MELIDTSLHVDTFLAVTVGIVVLFIGKRLNRLVPVLSEYSIPEPVSGGMTVALILFAVHSFADISVHFELGARDVLLVYFFTTIGINASFRDLAAGGKPLALLLIVTLLYMVIQNLTGVGVAHLLGLEPVVGLLGGTVSLIGGHGTAIAWAPRFVENYGVSNAMEIGIACATFGLVLASVIGGPVAKFLVQRHKLTVNSDDSLDVGISDEEPPVRLNYMELLDAVLAIHICIVIGFFMDTGLESLGIQLPLFVSCLFGGIIMTNLRPRVLPRITGTDWPSRTPAMALIADISLGTFLAMSLMSMQLWEIVDLAGALFSIMGAQLVIAVIFMVFIVFPVMGRNYDAAVIASGFGGFTMGATPTAMANMSAVTKRYGPCHQAFIIVPLVGAFFIDVSNVILIQLSLAWLG